MHTAESTVPMAEAIEAFVLDAEPSRNEARV